MTPKEKADSLMNKYRTIIRKTNVVSDDEIYLSQQCALLAVDEILNAHLFDLDEKQYWQQVKTKIQSL